MTRTGRGGYRPKKQRPAPVARFKLWVAGGGQIRANTEATKQRRLHPGETLVDEHPNAGLWRYLNPGRAK